jgi:hypothetical protein
MPKQYKVDNWDEEIILCTRQGVLMEILRFTICLMTILFFSKSGIMKKFYPIKSK